MYFSGRITHNHSTNCKLFSIGSKCSTQSQLSWTNDTLPAYYTASVCLRGQYPEAIRAVALLLRNAYICLTVTNAQAL